MIVLDTHIFLWAILQPDRIPDTILAVIEREPQAGLAAISLWEIAMLWERRRIELPEPLLPWLDRALQRPRLRLIPLDQKIAARSASLSMHGDPADRLIAATAIELDCPLATVDRRLTGMTALKTVH